MKTWEWWNDTLSAILLPPLLLVYILVVVLERVILFITRQPYKD